MFLGGVGRLMRSLAGSSSLTPAEQLLGTEVSGLALDFVTNTYANRVVNGTDDPIHLFRGGEQGIMLDPSDITTLFQDAAGTTPLTNVEQPVGLALDKRLGLALGSELVTNGDFSNGTTGWESGTTNQTLTVVSGEAKSETTGASGRPLLYRPIAFATTDVLYKVEFDVYSPNYSGSINVSLNDSLGPDAYSFRPSVTATRTRISSYLRAGPTPKFYISATGTIPTGTIVYFDNVSVKQVQGNHAFQTTSTARPILSARYNLLTQTENFAAAAWTKTNTIVPPTQYVAPDGTTTAELVYPTTSGTGRFVNQNVGLQTQGTTFTSRISIKSAGVGFAVLYNVQGNSSLYVNLSTGLTSNVGSNISNLTSAIDANGWVTVSFMSILTSGTNATFFVGPCDASGSTQVTANGTSGIYIWGADLRVANDGVNLPPYQRVGAAVNASTNPSVTGVPDYDAGPEWPRYLRCDGVDDKMLFGTITGTNGVSFVVAASVDSISDTPDIYLSQSVISAFDSALSKDFSLGFRRASGSLAASIYAESLATSVEVRSASTVDVRTRYILTGTGSATSTNLRVNGLPSNSGAGTVNDLRVKALGHHGGVSGQPFFGGRVYGVIGIDRIMTPVEIAAVEAWLNGKAKVYA